MTYQVNHLPPVSELRGLYEEFNTTYFEGKLPAVNRVAIRWNSRLTSAAGNCSYSSKIINLSSHYHTKFPQEIEATLLHEMVHLAGVMNHGLEFDKEMYRINAKGGVQITKYSREKAVVNWAYTCEMCARRHTRTRRLKNGGQSHHCKCGGRLAEAQIGDDRIVAEKPETNATNNNSYIAETAKLTSENTGKCTKISHTIRLSAGASIYHFHIVEYNNYITEVVVLSDSMVEIYKSKKFSVTDAVKNVPGLELRSAKKAIMAERKKARHS